jgi:hypothetical protein
MSDSWKRHEHDDIEGRLRSARPEPGDELVSRLSSQAGASRRSTGRSRAGWRPARLALAMATAACAFGSVFAFAQEPSDNGKRNATPAADQYEEKVTICHRPPGNPSNGQTLTLPRSAAEAHLRNHPQDSVGGCKGKGGVAGETGESGSGGAAGGTGTGAAADTVVDPGSGAQGSLAFTGLALGILASIGLVLLVGGWLVRGREPRPGA